MVSQWTNLPSLLLFFHDSHNIGHLTTLLSHQEDTMNNCEVPIIIEFLDYSFNTFILCEQVHRSKEYNRILKVGFCKQPFLLCLSNSFLVLHNNKIIYNLKLRKYGLFTNPKISRFTVALINYVTYLPYKIMMLENFKFSLKVIGLVYRCNTLKGGVE